MPHSLLQHTLALSARSHCGLSSTQFPRSSALRCLCWAAVMACLVATGCAAKEHRYTVRDLPAGLLAERWHSPSAIDLSRTKRTSRPQGIERGDTVEVVLSTGPRPADTARITTIVGEDGTVALPVAGRVTLAGEPPEAAGHAIVQACHDTSGKEPQFVQVTLQQPRQNRISVLGAVAHPGSYTLPRDSSDLVSALAAAGGLGRDVGEQVVIQRRATPAGADRPGGSVRHADFADEKRGSDLARAESPAKLRQEISLPTDPLMEIPATELGDGDVVFVERRDPPSVLVTGTVHRPGRYEFPVGQDFRVLDAVARAEGIPNKVVDTVVICRRLPKKSETTLIEVSLHQATREPDENLRLMPGDIISVEPTAKSLMKDGFKYIGSALAAGIGFARR